MPLFISKGPVVRVFGTTVCPSYQAIVVVWAWVPMFLVLVRIFPTPLFLLPGVTATTFCLLFQIRIPLPDLAACRKHLSVYIGSFALRTAEAPRYRPLFR